MATDQSSPETSTTPGPSDRSDALDQTLARIEARLDRLEGSIGRLTAMLDEAPMVLGAITDVADAHLKADGGASADERARKLARVAGKLTRPATLSALEAIVDRAERLESAATLIDTLPAQAAMLADITDDYLGAAAAKGVDADARLRQLVRVAGKATDPRLLGALEKLVERGDDFAKAVDLLDQLPGAMATGVDVLDSAIARANERGIDIIELGAMLAHGGEQFARFFQGPEFKALIDSGVLDPAAIETVGQVGAALASTKQGDAPRPVGFFGLMGAIRDDDVQRALGFAIEFGRRFGQALSNGQPRLPS